MESATLHTIKKELQELSQKQLVEFCIALAKYKKDNKEFLDYLLFEAHDKNNFVLSVKKLIDEHFEELKTQSNLYYVKKGLRKLLRIVSKYCKYIADKGLAADLHIYFCKKLKDSGIPYHKSQLLVNMYDQQLKKINSFIKTLHEDLQNDYLREIEEL
ncbi:MAG: hypothetical protein SFY56_05425 [Bacteroidota bacterium]|nr:hypothetical protein [Bacteroidota bacterium]